MGKACGLNVHKDSVFACILNEQGEKFFEKRFGTLTPDLTQLRDVLVELRLRTCSYGKHECLLDARGRVLQSDVELILTNPYFISQLPGRKSDAKDAAWIAKCLQKTNKR